MVANPFRIRGSNFSMLPNPCSDMWEPGVNMLKCMQAFHAEFDRLYDDTPVTDRGSLLNLIHRQFAEDRFSDAVLSGVIDLDVREAAHTALDEISEHFNAHIRQSELRSVLAGHISEILRASNQLEIALNYDDESGAKEERLMKLYFKSFRKTVTTFTRVGTLTILPEGSPAVPRSETQQHDRSALWLALVFRMWCWFLLHNFDEADRMIVPSQFLGSRYPVFIG